MDNQNYLIIIIVCVLIYTIYQIYITHNLLGSAQNETNQIDITNDIKPSDIKPSDIKPSEIKPIHIDKPLYEKMVDNVTNYSLLSADYNKKMILIYLSTFHLFDMNYGIMTLKKLDAELESYPYHPNDIQFPKGNMHHNLQKAIISNITLKIINSDLFLSHDTVKDRVIIDIYLNNLFTTINII